MYTTRIYWFSWGPHKTLTWTQRTPVASSCSPLWLSRMKVWNANVCLCTMWIPPADGFRYPLCWVAAPGSQAPYFVAAGHASSQGCSPTLVAHIEILSVRPSVRPTLFPSLPPSPLSSLLFSLLSSLPPSLPSSLVPSLPPSLLSLHTYIQKWLEVGKAPVSSIQPPSLCSHHYWCTHIWVLHLDTPDPMVSSSMDYDFPCLSITSSCCGSILRDSHPHGFLDTSSTNQLIWFDLC